ncbi:MAG TPA: hypothetical protein VL379_20490 [Pseudomonadales bacterium]|nr:hypothetical protein [Pseudomonadales bacterium]
MAAPRREHRVPAPPHRRLLGDTFSAADIVMGFTLIAGRMLGVVDDRNPTINTYLERLQARPALQKTMAIG